VFAVYDRRKTVSLGAAIAENCGTASSTRAAK